MKNNRAKKIITDEIEITDDIRNSFIKMLADLANTTPRITFIRHRQGAPSGKWYPKKLKGAATPRKGNGTARQGDLV